MAIDVNSGPPCKLGNNVIRIIKNACGRSCVVHLSIKCIHLCHNFKVCFYKGCHRGYHGVAVRG